MRFPVAVLAVCVFAVACSRPGSDDRAFQWTNEIPPGATVHLRNGNGDIAVHRSAGNAVVTGALAWRKGREGDVKFQVNQAGNEYYLCAMWRGSGKCAESGYRGRPSNSFLSMFSLFHRNSDTRATLVAELPANVVVDAKTEYGSVTIDGISGGVTARAANGTVSARNVSGPLSLSAARGDVNLATDSLAATDSVHLQTTTGTVRAELPASLDGAFDLSVVNGTVTSTFPLDTTKTRARGARRLQGHIGASSRVIKARAINGTVSVTARSAHTEH